MNPFCRRADFDGDGTLDFAAIIRERSSGEIGIAFIHRPTPALYIVGAETAGVHEDDYLAPGKHMTAEAPFRPGAYGIGPVVTATGD